MVGSSMLVDKLRVMLCFELFLNSKFYASYPFLQHFFEKNKEQFIKLSPVLSYTASHSTFDSINQEFGRLEFANEEFEAIHLCEDRVWCSFLSVFSLSSVLKKMCISIILISVQKNIVFYGTVLYRHDNHMMIVNLNHFP